MNVQPIHYKKARKSDFLAGVDLEIFELEGKSKTLTIDKVEYKENFKVNGLTKPRGIVISFKEPYAKPLICNSTNADFIKEKTGVIDASKWVGFSVEFYFNTKVQMKRETVGGIRIKSVNTNGLVPDIKDISSRIKECANRAELLSVWTSLNEEEQVKYKREVEQKGKTF